MRSEFKAKMAAAKEEKRKKKLERDYEIFSDMGYRYSSEVYSLQSKHPMSRDRYNRALELISSSKSTNQGWLKVAETWEVMSTKQSFMRC